jgi:sporulation protein YlmC with PRC-barrel domain
MSIDPDHIIDATVYDAQGEQIGTVGDVYVDDDTGQPVWLLIDTGFFGRGLHVPAQGAELHEEGYRLPYTTDVLRAAPEVDAGAEELGEVDEAELFRYYGLPVDGEAPSIVPPPGGLSEDELDAARRRRDEPDAA